MLIVKEYLRNFLLNSNGFSKAVVSCLKGSPFSAIFEDSFSVCEFFLFKQRQQKFISRRAIGLRNPTTPNLLVEYIAKLFYLVAV